MEQPLSTLGLPNYKLQQLFRLGYFYLKDLNPSNEKISNILQNDLQVLQNTPQIKSALDFYQEETTQGSIVTFIKNLDDILGGGVHLKQITEFCGDPGSGKSQISYLLCINVQFPYWCGGAAGETIYINTKFGFNPERLREIAVKSSQTYKNLKSTSVNLKEFNSYFKIENIMKRVHFIQIVTDIELIAAINVLENWLQINKNIKLIIVDSITAPVRFAATEKRVEILNNIIYNLKLLAQRYNLAVVVTNEMTTKISSGNEILTVPSFGSSYYHKINTRIQLSKLSRDVFKAMLIKSASMPFREVSFQIP